MKELTLIINTLNEVEEKKNEINERLSEKSSFTVYVYSTSIDIYSENVCLSSSKYYTNKKTKITPRSCGGIDLSNLEEMEETQKNLIKETRELQKFFDEIKYFLPWFIKPLSNLKDEEEKKQNES